MESFKECSIWEKTEIIDLPFLPFDVDKKVTSKMINESAKYIKKVKNVNFREADFERNLKNEKRFIFYQADTLIGLDISIIDVSSLTYLDQFFFLLKMYPMVMINSFMTEESMKKIALHSYCLEHNYILPVFGSIPFLDKALSGQYYGENIVKLFKGELEKIKLEDFKTASKKHSINELKIRFPQFEITNDEISFRPQVSWLGVADKQIENLLMDLFNNNIERFNFKKKCEEYNIEESKFASYIEKSMLFYKDGEEVVFRLQRKAVYWGFMCNLAAQFEREMIERDAICYDLKIDESIGTIKKIDEKIYHKLGNLFSKYDSFSYKMFSYIKRLLDTREYSNVLIIDNGNMNGIVSMVQGIGMQDNLYEILDYYSVAVKYPDVDYSKLKGQSVLIIIDIINTGRLIESTLDILAEYNCEKIGIFSFMINQNFDIDRLISEKNVVLSYFTEKELNRIDDILDKEYIERFVDDRDLNYKLLWGDVGKNVEFQENKAPYFYQMRNEELYKCYNNYDFGLGSDINTHSFIYQKIKHLLVDKDIIIIYEQFANLKKLIKSIIDCEKLEEKIKVFDINDASINLARATDQYKNKQVLILIPLKLTKDIDKFIKANKFARVEFLDLVGCEIYYLDNDKIIYESEIQKSYVFQSKLKFFMSSQNNPQIDYINN